MFSERVSVGLLSAFLLLSSIPHAISGPIPDKSPNPLTGAPDFSKDPFPPYPSIDNITTKSIRGTRLYGWKGCAHEETQKIAEAYDDFYTLAQQPDVYNNIDWKD